jgi:hypothetical protein
VILAALILTLLYVVIITGLQGVVSPAQLQAHSSDALVYTAQAIGGAGWARTLPSALANVSRRFATPVRSSVVTGVLVIALTWVYLLATSVQGAFSAVVNTSGLLFGVFYILTALATITYYRRRIVTSFRDAITVGVLPVGAAVFLGWVLVKSSLSALAAQNWSLLGVLVTGLTLTAMARFGLRSVFFGLPRESDS